MPQFLSGSLHTAEAPLPGGLEVPVGTLEVSTADPLSYGQSSHSGFSVGWGTVKGLDVHLNEGFYSVSSGAENLELQEPSNEEDNVLSFIHKVLEVCGGGWKDHRMDLEDVKYLCCSPKNLCLTAAGTCS